ncbi:glycosyltransferase [Azotobacter vinelandii]
MQHARGAWIGFLDADDVAHPDMFGSMHEVASEHLSDIVVCGSYRVAESGERLGTKISFVENTEISTDVFGRFCRFEFGTGMLWNKLYRREIILPFKEMDFPWRQNLNEDLLLNIGCFFTGVHDLPHERYSSRLYPQPNQRHVDHWSPQGICGDL